LPAKCAFHAETTSRSDHYKLLLHPNHCSRSSVGESTSKQLERSHLGGLLTRNGAGLEGGGDDENNTGFPNLHLKRLMAEYVRYYHEHRTHLDLAKDTPAGRPTAIPTGAESKIQSLPRLGGLHHRYAVAA
jgi:hypothetical protein